jgi:IclR family mhp operon transcriptional activator
MEVLMESNQQLQSLKRGLKALTLFNDTGALTVSALAREIEVPRTTAHRILDTLVSEGYVERMPSGYGFKLTSQVKQLSEGYDEEFWVSLGATPLIEQLSEDIRWPLAVTTPRGDYMLLRVCTDHLSPLTFRKHRAGYKAPMMYTAAGHVYLAFCSPRQQKLTLDIILNSSHPLQKSARDTVSLGYLMDKIRRQGFFVLEHSELAESNIAVPVLVDGTAIGSITMRYIKGALKPHQVVDDYLAHLQATARRIGDAYRAEAAAIPHAHR